MSNSAVIDLLGVLAFGELVAFERTATDATFAPTVADKITLGKMATREFEHYEAISARIVALGADPIEAMQPFVQPLTDFHNTMKPNDWYEGLLKAYVGDGITADFYREVSAFLDGETAQLVEKVLSDVGIADFVVSRIKEATADDPKLAGRLALWGRRLMGEMISQASIVANARPQLASLFVASPNSNTPDLEELSTLVGRLTARHSLRMEAIGLAA